MIPSIDQVALDASHIIDDIFAQGHNGVAQRTSRVQIIVRNAINEYMRQLEDVDIHDLIAASMEFVSKVDRGDAKSTDSYAKFKRALRLPDANLAQTDQTS